MKAKLSKVLAMLLACVLIFTTLPLMAFASDEAANIYTVSNESPAIPMTVGTQIAVGDLAVTFSDGTVVAGDALTWISTGSGVSVKNGYLVAKEVGPVKLTVPLPPENWKSQYYPSITQPSATIELEVTDSMP